jgi:hypothetical protein
VKYLPVAEDREFGYEFTFATTKRLRKRIDQVALALGASAASLVAATKRD